MSGVSARHGGHHDAQKFSTVTFPAVRSGASGVPASVVPRIGGAGEPSGAVAAFGAAATRATAAARARKRIGKPSPRPWLLPTSLAGRGEVPVLEGIRHARRTGPILKKIRQG